MPSAHMTYPRPFGSYFPLGRFLSRFTCGRLGRTGLVEDQYQYLL
jgi:hypothetical protein